MISGAIPTSPSVIIVQYPLGRRFEQEVPPHSFWRTQFYMSDSEFVKFNFSVPSYAIIGIYGRKNVQPTHAQYDFFHVLDGNKIMLMDGSRGKRSANVSNTDSEELFQYTVISEVTLEQIHVIVNVWAVLTAVLSVMNNWSLC